MIASISRRYFAIRADAIGAGHAEPRDFLSPMRWHIADDSSMALVNINTVRASITRFWRGDAAPRLPARYARSSLEQSRLRGLIRQLRREAAAAALADDRRGPPFDCRRRVAVATDAGIHATYNVSFIIISVGQRMTRCNSDGPATFNEQ